jgi:hypothetical protein
VKRLMQMALVLAVVGAVGVGFVYGANDETFKLAGQTTLGRGADTLGAGWVVPGEIDTSLAIDARGCDKMTLYGFYAGDSLSWTLQYSFDGATWTSYASAATVNTDPAVAAALNVQTQLLHVATSGSDKTVFYDDFMWQKARLILNNVDHVDTLKSSVWKLYCKD